MIPASTLRELYEVQQLSVRQIAAKLGRKHETIRGWLRDAGIQTRTKTEGKLRSPYKGLWTPERDQIIRDMWHKVGCTTIARKIGCGVTKCAVLGRARRIGLPPHPQRPLSMTPDAIRKREETKRKNREMMGQQPVQSHALDERRLPASPERSLIDFSPNLRLQTMWVTCLQEVREQRGAQWRQLLGVKRNG